MSEPKVCGCSLLIVDIRPFGMKLTFVTRSNATGAARLWNADSEKFFAAPSVRRSLCESYIGRGAQFDQIQQPRPNLSADHSRVWLQYLGKNGAQPFRFGLAMEDSWKSGKSCSRRAWRAIVTLMAPLTSLNFRGAGVLRVTRIQHSALIKATPAWVNALGDHQTRPPVARYGEEMSMRAVLATSVVSLDVLDM